MLVHPAKRIFYKIPKLRLLLTIESNRICTQNLSECEPLLERLRRQKAEGGFVCAVCAAPTVLERAEVIEDESVTCYPSCTPQMGRPVESVPVIADGQLITGQGPGAAMLFALVVLAHLTDERTAHGVANGMIAEFS